MSWGEPLHKKQEREARMKAQFPELDMGADEVFKVDAHVTETGNGAVSMFSQATMQLAKYAAEQMDKKRAEEAVRRASGPMDPALELGNAPPTQQANAAMPKRAGVSRTVADVFPEYAPAGTPVYDSKNWIPLAKLDTGYEPSGGVFADPTFGPALTNVVERATTPKNWLMAVGGALAAGAIAPAAGVGVGGALAIDMGGQLVGAGLSGLAEPHVQDLPEPLRTGIPLALDIVPQLAGIVVSARNPLVSLDDAAKAKPITELEQLVTDIAPKSVVMELNPISGSTGPLNPAAINAPAGSALETAAHGAMYAEDTLPAGIARALDQSRTMVQADEPSVAARMMYRIPGVASILNPGRKLPAHVLEAYNGANSTRAEFTTQHAFPTRRPLLTTIDQQFGNEASTGGITNASFVGGVDESVNAATGAKYPGLGTVKDIFDRPEVYSLTPEQSTVIGAVESRNEVLRHIAVDDYGSDIKRFQRAQLEGAPPETAKGAYLPNIDRSEAARDIEEAVKQSESALMTSGRSKTRVYDTAWDRWNHDQNLVAAGKLKPEAAFVPETNIRVLLEGMDSFKANSIGSQVLRAGFGGKTLVQAKEEAAPALVDLRSSLQRQMESVRGKIDRRASSGSQSTAAAKQLEGRLNDIQTRFDRTADVAGHAETSLVELDHLEYLIDQLEAQFGSVSLDDRAHAAEFSAIQMDQYDSMLDDLKQAYTETVPGQSRESRSQIMAAIEKTKAQIARQLAKERVDDTVARNVQRTAESILARIGRSAQGIERGQTRIANAADVTAGTQGRAESALGNAVKRGYDRVDSLNQRATTAASDWATLRSDLADLKETYASVRRSYEAVNLRGEKFVGEGINRYFPADQVSQIKTLMDTEVHGLFRFMADWNAGVLTGDFSPILGQQGQLAWLTAPLQTTKAVFGGLAHGVAKGDVFRAFKADALAEDVGKNPQSWGDFAFYTGRAVSPGNVPGEFGAGLISRIPRVGEKWTAANDAIFTGVTRAQWRAWEDTVDGLIKGGMTRQEAMALAGHSVMEVIPTPNTYLAGMSRQQAAVVRAPLTSVTFVQRPLQMVSEATDGLANLLIPGHTVTPKQKLAIKNLIKMNATVAGLSTTSAAIYAQTHGLDPQKAMLNALNPNHKNFYSIILPNGDRIPLGGPNRAVFKAIAPAPVKTGDGEEVWLPFAGTVDFFKNRIMPFGRAQANLVRNEDFYGNKIVTKDFPINLVQIMEYEVESAVPISVGGLMGAARTQGLDAFTTVEGLTETVSKTVANMAGTNLGLPTPTDRLNLKAQNWPVADENGKMHPAKKDFYDLEPWQRKAILDANPDLAQQKIDNASDTTQAEYEVRTAAFEQQQGIDDALKAALARHNPGAHQDWKDATTSLRDRTEGALGVVYKESPERTPDPNKPWEVYGKIIADNTDPVTNKIDWDAVDRWRGENDSKPYTGDGGGTWEAAIARNTGLHSTLYQKERRAITRQMDEAGYFDIRDKVWAKMSKDGTRFGKSPEEFQEKIATKVYDKVIKNGGTPQQAEIISKRIISKNGLLKTWTRVSNNIEQGWIVKNRKLAAQAMQYGFFQNPREVEERAIMVGSRQ